jgi:hypothetical protein
MRLFFRIPELYRGLYIPNIHFCKNLSYFKCYKVINNDTHLSKVLFKTSKVDNFFCSVGNRFLKIALTTQVSIMTLWHNKNVL